MYKRIISVVFVVVFFMGFSSFNLVIGNDRMGDGNGFFTMKDALTFGRGKIIGEILDRKGEPVVNASILVENVEDDGSSSFSKTEQTDSKGNFKVRFLPVDTYKVTVTPEDGEDLLSNDTFNVNVFAFKTAIVDMTLSAKAPDGTAFVGSDACMGCHPGDHSAWLGTAHANTHLTPSESTVVAPFDNVTRFTSDEAVKFNAFISNDGYKVILIDLNDNSARVSYDVVRTHGGVAHSGKQRFHVMIGNSHYILPIQYNNNDVDAEDPEAAWISYHPERWYNDDGTLREPDPASHSYEQNCEGCHATGLSVAMVSEEFISSSTEIGIACEECHGPGELHVNTGGGDGNNIINPDFLTVEMGNQVCGQCHTRVVSKEGSDGANFETGYPAIVNGDVIDPYVPGNDLNDFLSFTKLSGDATPGLWNDDSDSFGEDASVNNHSKKHHQQGYRFFKEPPF